MSEYSYQIYKTNLLNEISSDKDEILLGDHLAGFDSNLTNEFLEKLNTQNRLRTVNTEYIITDLLRNRYPNLNLKFDINAFNSGNFFSEFVNYKPLQLHKFRSANNIQIDNFVCSFNGGDHPGRILLVSALSKFKFFSDNYCSKNFVFDKNKFDNAIIANRFYSIFFDSSIADKIVNFQYSRFQHEVNHSILSPMITKSFLHIVSESVATSHYPFITEKFLYSVVNQGLFLAYAQPGWHEYLEKYLGFKKYEKIFDYSFDSIADPVERLVALLAMVSKYSTLTSNDWNILYYLEKDAILYNYNHYKTGKYVLALKEAGQII